MYKPTRCPDEDKYFLSSFPDNIVRYLWFYIQIQKSSWDALYKVLKTQEVY